MQITNTHIIHEPKIEEKTKEHYIFIKKQFCDAYIKEEDFLKREDLYVLTIRNDDGILVALCLVKEAEDQDRRLKPLPSLIPCKHTKEYWLLNSEKFSHTNELPRKEKKKEKKDYNELLDNLLKPIKSPFRVNRKYLVTRYNVHRVIFTLVEVYYRGQGYNQQLLNFVYNRAEEQENVRYIVASIREPNEASIRSFLKNGYKISKRTTTPYKNKDKRIRVTRYLDLEKEINEDKTDPI